VGTLHGRSYAPPTSSFLRVILHSSGYRNKWLCGREGANAQCVTDEWICRDGCVCDVFVLYESFSRVKEFLIIMALADNVMLSAI
jgi:hypothetical protein